MAQPDICPCCDPITGTGLTGRCTCGGTDIDHNMLRGRLDIEPIRARHAYGDEEFIQHCEADVAALLEEVRRLRAVTDAAEHVHRVLHGLIAADAAPGVRARSAWDALDTALIAYRSAAPAR